MRCSDVSAVLGEEMAGSAVHAPALVLVEHPGPWGRDAATEAGGAVAALAEVAAAAGVRVQLVRRARREDRPRDGDPVVVLAHLTAAGGRAVTGRVAEPDLPSLPLHDLAAGRLPSGGPAGWAPAGRLWAVCTHARRDACCAALGRPLVEELQARAGPGQVWETTHLGGHRFAGTALLLPEGLVLGRLTPADVPAVVADVEAGRVPTRRLRGRPALRPAEQLAEAVLLRAQDTEAPGVVVTGSDAGTGPGGRRATVRAEVAGRGWRVVLDARPETTARPVSCGADASTPAGFTVLEVTPVDAPGRGVEAWEQTWAGRDDPGTPAAAVVDAVADLEPGTALDVAAGAGRHALWLARRGWDVDAVDFARPGLDLGRAAEARGSGGRPVRWHLADARAWDPPPDRTGGWDLVLLAHVQLPGVLARAATLLTPGGHLVVVGHADGTPGGPRDARLHHDPGALRETARAAGLDVRRCEAVPRGAGSHHARPGHDVVLAARRPAPA